MGKRIIILTGSELRHAYFRKKMAAEEGIEVVNSYCEGLEKSLGAFVRGQADNEMRQFHLEAREKSEKEFFAGFVAKTPDLSRPIFIPKGEINDPAQADKIIAAKPDILAAYGCSIVKEPLLGAFAGRFLNVHLGLSPYYMGSGTNFWPLVNGEPEFVGATFMHIDPGIDTGEIIHQMRADILPGDDPSTIGNRLIRDMVPVYTEIIRKIETLPRMPQPEKPARPRICKQKDYSEESVAKLYGNFKKGLVSKYVAEKRERLERAPIVENPLIMTDRPAKI